MIRTRRVRLDPDDDPPREIVEHLAREGLLAYPTETVYGLGGAVERGVVRRLQRVKERGDDRPFLLLVPEAEGVPLRWSSEARALARRFWPGPLTLVLPDPEESFPPGVRSREGGVAIRRSPHPFLRQLGGVWSRPLLSTSANRAGDPPALDADQVEAALASVEADEEVWVADGGPLPPSEPSSVVDCTGSRPRVLREGAVTMDELRRVIPGLKRATR